MFRTGKNPSGRSYYDFSPAVGWRVVLVDTYEISQMHAAGSPAYQEARRVLEANNPNDTLHGCVACVPSCDATPFPRLQPQSAGQCCVYRDTGARSFIRTAVRSI